MFMIFFVLDNPEQLEATLQAWEKAGIRGATIIESTGIHRQLKQVIPLRYLFQTTGSEEQGHLTLLAIVETQELVQACLLATESVTGDLDGPNTGVFASWPLATVKGLPLQEG
jgi:nitrogen regulatory protein P-II 1